MSWSFQLQKINQSFDQIASWYREFIHRTELCFRQFHERITRLEEQQNFPGPTDEQVERVMRKILSEKFADPTIHHVEKDRNPTKDRDAFVGNPNDFPLSKIDVASLLVSPESIPSKTYTETFQMLESRLDGYPDIEPDIVARDGNEDAKSTGKSV
ncbi:hypothetical protein BDW02DRAFT_411569 [Decorospora gaudefroyi]|uniref:Uncharacterized protein n=1 Tax=Decorospora gaudefroyi TaxID=184978 RepID=A0A6A5KCN9_9PLEO|nr:hypothetical protein BDW02DRAFT_411569 [Decorospora gaudefroyi]